MYVYIYNSIQLSLSLPLHIAFRPGLPQPNLLCIWHIVLQDNSRPRFLLTCPTYSVSSVSSSICSILIVATWICSISEFQRGGFPNFPNAPNLHLQPQWLIQHLEAASGIQPGAFLAAKGWHWIMEIASTICG